MTQRLFPNPSFLSLGFPTIRSRAIIAIFTTISHSLSFLALEKILHSGLYLLYNIFLSRQELFHTPPYQDLFIQSSVEFTHVDIFIAHAKVFLEKVLLTIEPAIPIETEPIDRYDLPFIYAADNPARTKRRIFSLTSSGIELSLHPGHHGRICQKQAILHCMTCKCCCKINGTWPFSAIKSHMALGISVSISMVSLP